MATTPTSVPAAGSADWRAWLLVRRGWWLGLGGLALLALVPAAADQLFGFSAGFELHRVTLIIIFVVAALGQNILTGYAAQPSLGNAAFFGIGGYLLVWLTNDLNQPFWVGLLLAMAASAALSFVIGGPALRVSGTYLAIATLGLVYVTGSLLDLWDKTAGRQNYDLNNLPLWLQDDHNLYFVCLGLTTTVVFLMANLLRARVGRAWLAIRESEVAAAAFGVPVARYTMLAFAVSATLTGLAGGMYALWATTVSSSMSSADLTITLLAMIVVGGLGSIAGSVLGAIFVGFLPLLLGELPNTLTVGGAQVQISTLTTGIYGLLLLLALILFPHGLNSLLVRGGALIRRLARRGRAA